MLCTVTSLQKHQVFKDRPESKSVQDTEACCRLGLYW